MLIAIDPGANAGWALFNGRELVICGCGTPPIHSDIKRAMIERPIIKPFGRQKERPKDIITLALRAGEAAGRLMTVGVQIEYVEPHVWKGGSIPKKISHARIRRKLTSQENLVIDRYARTHDAMDAVGIGLFAIGRRA